MSKIAKYSIIIIMIMMSVWSKLPKKIYTHKFLKRGESLFFTSMSCVLFQAIASISRKRRALGVSFLCFFILSSFFNVFSFSFSLSLCVCVYFGRANFQVARNKKSAYHTLSCSCHSDGRNKEGAKRIVTKRSKIEWDFDGRYERESWK